MSLIEPVFFETNTTSEMQIPEEWDERQRTGVAVSGNVKHAPTARAKHITNAELVSFAAEAASQHVKIHSSFMRLLHSDLATISECISAQLPQRVTETGKRKGDAEDTAAPSRSEMRLELDTLLSRLPYKRLMQDLVPYHSEKIMPSVPHVSRCYEETYMREKIHASERSCVMGAECECMFIDKTCAFVGVEFLVPGEEPAATPQTCVLCSRAITQQLFHDIVLDNMSFNTIIQRYGNLHSVPNEYAKEAMLICPPNGPLHVMPLPIMSHQRNRYSVVRVGGVRYIRQHGVYFQ